MSRELKRIKNISILRNVKLDNRINIDELNDFFIVEDESGPNIILNLNTGEDHSSKLNKSIAIFKNKTKIINLYTPTNNFYQERLKINTITNITYHKDICLYSKLTDKLISITDIVEIKDDIGNVILLDIANKILYTRQNIYELVKQEKLEEIVIFKLNEHNKLYPKTFRKISYFLKKIKNFFFGEVYVEK